MARGMSTTNRAAFPWRTVISIDRFRAGNQSRGDRESLELILECGHTLRRAASRGEPTRVRCTLCGMKANNEQQ